VPEYPGPIAPALFPDSALAVALGAVSGGGSSRSGVRGCRKLRWGIRKITLSCKGNTSTSYKDPNHAGIAGGKAGRFFFAPKYDSVKVAWKLKNKENATTLTLQLFRAGEATPIWSRVLDAGEAAAEKLDRKWDGSFPDAEWVSFPAHLVTVEHSPYKLKAIAGANREDRYEVRWTYFDVLIHSIDLTWGGRGLIPPGNRGDIDGLYRHRTQKAEKAINNALGLQAQPNGVLDPADHYEVKLPCNQFTNWMYDMEDGNAQRKTTLWLNHEKQWGDGPRIPLVAKIYLASADGGGIHAGDSAKALGGAKFLWDWESVDQIAGLGAAGHGPPVTAFLTDSLEYLRTDGNCPPGSTNCHEDHGGKRGGAKKVFARLDAVSASSTACATRVWATFEQAMLTGPYAGCVGVMFQPSRIALDTYKVTVYAPPDAGGGGPAALDRAVTADTLRADYPSLPSGASGVFEILREIRIRYVRKSAAVEEALLASIGDEYRRAGVVLDWGTPAARAADEARLAANFQAWFTAWLAAPDAKAQNSVNATRARFEALDQLQAGTGADTAFGFIVQSWEAVVRPTLLDSIREYVLVKPRLFNPPLRAYTEWLRTPGHTSANNDQFMFPFYRGLSAGKKAKVDEIFERKRTAAGLQNKAEYESALADAGVQMARLIAQSLLLDIGVHGMIVFHVETPVAFRQIDGSIVAPNSDTGGLSPSTSAQWSGRGSVHLIFLPETVPPAGDPKYTVPVTSVIKHEAGHNLYLCHAPAASHAAGGPKNQAPGACKYLHDQTDLLCLMNYDQRSDHLCGYCNLKLRGWGTVGQGEDGTKPGPIDGGLVKLWQDAAQNRNP